ncbi:hypothetical protein LCGC14_0363750 [marine sediment metagenome]|uniref:Uncharacterized protein n=1 Tax=marine sediment metagenome TaxID=412755 RepID=A0A0F9VU90_9ZZZZ
MTPERFQALLDRLEEYHELVGNFYLENPEFAHFIRMADTIGSVIAVGACRAISMHWECFCNISGATMGLYALARIRPEILDAIYEEFKEDFQEMIPEGQILWKVVESREYPIPPELLQSPELPGDGLEDC